MCGPVPAEVEPQRPVIHTSDHTGTLVSVRDFSLDSGVILSGVPRLGGVDLGTE